MLMAPGAIREKLSHVRRVMKGSLMQGERLGEDLVPIFKCTLTLARRVFVPPD